MKSRVKQVIHLEHRPEEPGIFGTPLKNGADGERLLNVSPELMELIGDYIGHNRFDVTDRFGREPQFNSKKGRVATATFRRDSDKLTRPSEVPKEIPSDRVDDTVQGEVE